MARTRRSNQRTTPKRTTITKPAKTELNKNKRNWQVRATQRQPNVLTTKKFIAPKTLTVRSRKQRLSDVSVKRDSTVSVESSLSSPKGGSSSSEVSRQKRIQASDSDDEPKVITKRPTKRRRVVESDDDDSIEVLRLPSEQPKTLDHSYVSVANSKRPAQISISDDEVKAKPIRRVSNRQKQMRMSTELKIKEKKIADDRMVRRNDKENERLKLIKNLENKRHQINDDEVAAEFGVVLLRPPANASINRVQFHQKPLQKMADCRGRLKRQVKHLELTYKTRRNHEGIAFNKVAALYDGVYKAESSSKDACIHRHVVGFFKSDQFFLIPVNETYEMMRQITRPIDVNILEQNRAEDANLSSPAPPVLNPIRVRFARTETEWQRKRREQSFQYRQMLYDQDQWLEMGIKREDVRTLYKKGINKARDQESVPINTEIKLSLI